MFAYWNLRSSVTSKDVFPLVRIMSLEEYVGLR